MTMLLTLAACDSNSSPSGVALTNAGSTEGSVEPQLTEGKTLDGSQTISTEIKRIFGPSTAFKIASNAGGFDTTLDPGDGFGRDHDSAGNINGQGLGAFQSDGGAGALWK
jgi:hypothetical protein